MDKPKVVTRKHSKKKHSDAESLDGSVMLWGSRIRIDGPKAVLETLTTADLNRLRWQFMGGNHQDRYKAKAWLDKRKLEMTSNASDR